MKKIISDYVNVDVRRSLLSVVGEEFYDLSDDALQRKFLIGELGQSFNGMATDQLWREYFMGQLNNRTGNLSTMQLQRTVMLGALGQEFKDMGTGELIRKWFLESFVNPYKGLIDSGATMILDPNRPSGKPFTKLSPLTLPNGVGNGESLQRVSDDRIIKASDIKTISTLVGVTRANFLISDFINIKNLNGFETLGTHIFSTISTPLNDRNFQLIEYAHYQYSSTSFGINLPLGTTLEQAQAMLAGEVIRYQLAVPVDTFNVPFINPMIDLANKPGINRFDPIGVVLDYIIGDNGALPAYAGGFYDPKFYKVNGPFTISSAVSAFMRIAFYDKSGTYIGRVTSMGTIFTPTIPENATTFRISCTTTQLPTFMLNEGATPFAYEPYAKNNALLQNFIPSSADGYATIIAPNDSGANSVDVNQVVVNGDFANGMAGWASNGGTQEIITSGSEKILRVSSSGNNFPGVRKLSLPIDIGKYYLTAIARRVSGEGTLLARPYLGLGVGSGVYFSNTSFERISVIQQVETANPILYFLGGNSSNITSVCEVTGIMLIRMTGTPYENFTAEQMNQLVSKGYFEGNKTIRYSTPTVLNLDGSNSFGALASSDALNPIGTGDFGIADVIRTNSLKDQYLITKSTSSEATTQYGVKITSTGNLVLILEGTSITLATGLLANTFYKILISRDNGTLRCELNGVQTYSQANTISLTAKANTLIGALSTIAGGTTQTGYANVSQGIKVFCKAHDFAKFKSEFYKLALKQYGL